MFLMGPNLHNQPLSLFWLGEIIIQNKYFQSYRENKLLLQGMTEVYNESAWIHFMHGFIYKQEWNFGL